MTFSRRLALFAAPFSAILAALPARAHIIGDTGAHFHEGETALTIFGMGETSTLLVALSLGLTAGALFALFRRASH